MCVCVCVCVFLVMCVCVCIYVCMHILYDIFFLLVLGEKVP